MSQLAQNIINLFTTPGMALAYSKWLFYRRLLGEPPKVNLTSDVRIGGWINFSEYWCFRKGMIDAEKAAIQLQLDSIKDLNNRPKIAIDIGANVGLFTMYLGTVGYDKVYAFEPVPQTFERLQKNLAANTFTKELIINCLAVGAQEGFVEFDIFDDVPAVNRLSNPNRQSEHKTIGSMQVPVTTLDKYCADRKIDVIDFLKIDVEGMEPLVIQGASQLLKRKLVTMILIEICPANLNLTGNSIENLYNLFVDVGYTPHTLLSNGHIGAELNLDELRSITLDNILLLPTATL
jgi:FkbM family methyltransferase